MEKVFVYGTLRVPEIRNRIVGREVLSISTNKLRDYKLSSVSEEGQTYPIIIQDENSKEIIEGEILEVSEKELEALDAYEGDLYIRRKISLEDGTTAWAYTQ